MSKIVKSKNSAVRILLECNCKCQKRQLKEWNVPEEWCQCEQQCIKARLFKDKNFSAISFPHTYMYYLNKNLKSRGQQTFSIKGQGVNMLGVTGYTVSVTTSLWHFSMKAGIMLGHGGEFWQNVVRRREWQTTPVFLPWEPHEHYEMAKRYETERWASQVSSVQYATGEAKTKLQKEWRPWAKMERTPSCGYVWWWK